MGAIEPDHQDNVILFPKTIEYYQLQLTRMLEEERYGEAARMLRFLLRCQSEDRQCREEWESLLGWLATAFPETVRAEDGTVRMQGNFQQESAEETEADLLKKHVRAKAAEDDRYAEKLLDLLAPHVSVEKQMMALDQLAHLDHRGIGVKLREWLTQNRLHPLVQFKALQALRLRGETGPLQLHKLGAAICVDIEETPLRSDQFPPQIDAIRLKVQRVCETDRPGLAEFVDQTWTDFLAFVYGTSVYAELAGLDEAGRDVWAAALHQVMHETMFGSADESETKRLFGLKAAHAKPWQKAYQVIKLFVTVSFP